jgi:FADH2 O2-dependent halogenase
MYPGSSITSSSDESLPAHSSNGRMLELRRFDVIRRYDIAVFGSGFGGSLMAMIGKRMGFSVVLIERGKHPRMAIGESSTPLANLLLDDLAKQYNMPAIRPLIKWGSWQQSYPDLGCGLKRGFTFYHHEPGSAARPDPSRECELLVAASPHDAIADTHWYRADFDSFFVQQAQALGVDYLDETTTDSFVDGTNGVSFEVLKAGKSLKFEAGFAIDATGPRGLLHRALRLQESPLDGYPATQALFCHFSGVRRPPAMSRGEDSPPYPAEDAAVHHVFDGGWIWVLRFNNGMTSAGVAATKEASSRLGLQEGEVAWRRLIHSIPTLMEQFAEARSETGFTFVSRLSFMTSRVCGARWAMLPSAAGFVDPLLSTGFPLTLLGVGRLAHILSSDWTSLDFRSNLQAYEQQTIAELLATSRLVAALYATMGNFAVFRSIGLLYFAAASYSETVKRLGKPHLATSFLLHDDPGFGPRCRALLDRALHLSSKNESAILCRDILDAIEPLDVASLSNPKRRGWYPVDAGDLLRSAAKVGATAEEIENMLHSCNFYAAEPVSEY